MNLTEIEEKELLIKRHWGSITAFAEYMGVSRQSIRLALDGKNCKKLARRINRELEKLNEK